MDYLNTKGSDDITSSQLNSIIESVIIITTTSSVIENGRTLNFRFGDLGDGALLH